MSRQGEVFLKGKGRGGPRETTISKASRCGPACERAMGRRGIIGWAVAGPFWLPESPALAFLAPNPRVRGAHRLQRRRSADRPTFRWSAERPAIRPTRAARAGWAALRRFRFRDIPLRGERWSSGVRGERSIMRPPRRRARAASRVRLIRAESSCVRATRRRRLGGGWPPSPLRLSGIRFSSPSGLAGPAAHETLLLCGCVVGTEVGILLVRLSPSFSWTRGSLSTSDCGHGLSSAPEHAS